MSVNARIGAILEEIARMIEVLGEDSFRASAHARAARALADFPQDLATLDRAAILAIPGVGAKIADKVLEFVKTGSMAEHEELRAKVPAGVLELMQVPGLGPKTAHVLWKQGDIHNIPALEKAIADGSILKLPRMGEKSVQKLKESLAFAKQSGSRLWLGRAHAVARVFVEALRTHPSVARVEPAGSLRRGKDTIGDIDILVALKKGHERDAEKVGGAFCKVPGVVQVIAHGESKCSVRYALDNDTGRWKLEGAEGEAKAGPSVQVDLRVLPLASWGAALMYFTGSKEHNIRLRQRALDRGLTLNDWGLFPIDEEKTAPHLRGVKPVAGASEDEVYAKLQLPYLPPEIREDRGECDLDATPALTEIDDIKAELHAHTTASDGVLSIDELVDEAKKRGFHTIAVTDHSKSSVQANGLSVERLLAHVDAVHAARARHKGITILAGSEVDILADGTLDYDDKTLAKLDIVVASPHTALSQDSDAATARLVRAVSHPRVNVLGHPTGRLINKRKGLEPDLAKVFAAAKAHKVALEINAHWMRLDLRDTHVRAALAAGCLIAIDCDVHERADFDNLRFGVMTARRGWCPPASCVNTWPQAKLKAWLAK